jgi:hypothetical protein
LPPFTPSAPVLPTATQRTGVAVGRGEPAALGAGRVGSGPGGGSAATGVAMGAVGAAGNVAPGGEGRQGATRSASTAATTAPVAGAAGAREITVASQPGKDHPSASTSAGRNTPAMAGLSA